MIENNDRKRKNRRFFEMIKKKLSEKMRKYVESCSTFMMFYADVTLEKRKLMNANSCKNRFCPFCSYRKARKEGLKISILMKKLDLDQNYEFLLLTLTAPNVPGEELEKEIKELQEQIENINKRNDLLNIELIEANKKVNFVNQIKTESFQSFFFRLV